MCWKQEWAHAINNLQHAIEHVKKAQAKLRKRQERNEKTLKWRKLNKPDKHEEKLIERRIEKNLNGQAECDEIIASLIENQALLFKMVHKYGIRKSEDPKRVYKLMGNYPVAEKLKELSIEETKVREMENITGLTCITAYNGNCDLKCKHSMPHRENKECYDFCERMGIETECIEVEFADWSLNKEASRCGKKIEKDCLREHPIQVK